MKSSIFTLSTLLIVSSVQARGWNWKTSSSSPSVSGDSGKCAVPEKSNNPFNSTDDYNSQMCLQAIQYKNLDFTNITAMFQPAYWECEYPGVSKFCSDRGNGTFCYRPACQMNDTCLDMAVVRCPEGIISSCRSNYICNELINNNSNYTCNNSITSPLLLSADYNYTESGLATCQAIEDVIKLPQAMNVTTTVDSQNNTFTIGQQVFGFPFVTTTTVNCTYTTLSVLPTGFPQPPQPSNVCFNPDLPYDQMIPKTTCAGPYPPGPMTTFTLCNTTTLSSSSCYIPTSSCSSSSSSACPIGSSSTSSDSLSSSYYTTTPTSSCEITSSMYSTSSFLSSVSTASPSPYSGGSGSTIIYDFEPEDSYSYDTTPSPSSSSDQDSYEPTPRRFY